MTTNNKTVKHKIYESKTLILPNVGVYEYKAFCSCGWISAKTTYPLTYAMRVEEHLDDQQTP